MQLMLALTQGCAGVLSRRSFCQTRMPPPWDWLHSVIFWAFPIAVGLVVVALAVALCRKKRS